MRLFSWPVTPPVLPSRAPLNGIYLLKHCFTSPPIVTLQKRKDKQLETRWRGLRRRDSKQVNRAETNIGRRRLEEKRRRRRRRERAVRNYHDTGYCVVELMIYSVYVVCR